MERAAIVAGVRTPIGKMGKAYADIHAADLLGVALNGVMDAAGIDPERVDQVLNGTVVQSGEPRLNVGRNAWLAAGLPHTVPATTLDTQCGSSQQATNLGAALIMSGQADVIVASGLEAMSRTGLANADLAGGELSPYSESLRERTDMGINQGIAGERIAAKYGVTREESDRYGMRSHQLSDEGWNDGAFKDEAVFVERNGEPILSRDEGIRLSDYDVVSSLKPVYAEGGIITAASASQLSDGASAVVLASESFVQANGLTPLAWVKRTRVVGVDPSIMLEGPIEATRQMLQLENLTVDDIDLFEIHEAYATVVMSWWKNNPGVPDEKLNIHGGAISQGHPFGASGTRQLAHLAHTMSNRGLKVGLQAMCCGGGIGTGTILVRD